MFLTVRTMASYIPARLHINNERGATMVEYGLMIAFVALVVGVAALTLGGKVSSLFGDAGTSLDSAPTPTYST